MRIRVGRRSTRISCSNKGGLGTIARTIITAPARKYEDAQEEED